MSLSHLKAPKSLYLIRYNEMVSVNNAIQLINDHVAGPRRHHTIALSKAKNTFLAQDIISPIHMPPFRQSAMDGYALNIYEDSTYTLLGEIKAGDAQLIDLKPGECVRIFTGAAVPNSANAIAIQENVIANGESIDVQSRPRLMDNIRPLGEQIKKGDIALQKGTKLTAAAIGFLASLGIDKVNVFTSPKIGLIVTGNELVQPGNKLEYGQIYESNSYMLISVLQNLGYDDITVSKVTDDYQSTYANLKHALETNDLVLVCGGISVGDYDFVGKALNNLGVTELFYKVNQKPGKPLYFGKHKTSYVFGLPGNPASALTCFYVYVQIALQKLSGAHKATITKLTARSQSRFKKKGDRAQFLKAVYKDNEVSILEGQNSSMLHTYALANALVVVQEDQNEILINDEVELILLPVF